MDSLQGQLLIASPALEDPNFGRTVVVIASHDEGGALGIILNRATDTEVADAAPELAELVDADDVIFVGGPVQPAAIVVLAEFEEPSRAALLVCDDVGLASDEVGLDQLGDVTRRRRVFAGYAGWGPGQLEAEIDREDWILTPATAEDVFSEEPAELWSEVLDRKGGTFRLIARMPLDPSLN